MLLFLDFKDDVIYIEYVHIWEYLCLHRIFSLTSKFQKSVAFTQQRKTVSIPVPESDPVLSNMVDRPTPNLMLTVLTENRKK